MKLHGLAFSTFLLSACSMLPASIFCMGLAGCKSANQPPIHSKTASTCFARIGKISNIRRTGPPETNQGFIASPYAPNMGYVDVRAYQPGTVVRCPYTGQKLRVPPDGQFVGIPLQKDDAY